MNNAHGLFIRQVRERLGWTQRQCAAFIGVHVTTWIKWEAGKTPRADMAAKIADFIAKTETADGLSELQAWRKDADSRREARRAGRDLHPNSKLGR